MITAVVDTGLNIHENHNTLFKTPNNFITSLNLENFPLVRRIRLIIELLTQFEQTI